MPMEHEDERAAKKAKRSRWGKTADAPAPKANGEATTGGKAPAPSFDQLQVTKDALEKAKRAAVLQKQIQQQMQSRGMVEGGADVPGHARKLLLDDFGREIDEHGRVVPMRKQPVSTLRVNQYEGKKEGGKKEGGRKLGAMSFVDPNLKTKKDDKKQEQWQRKRRFNFNEVGKFAAQESKMIREKKDKLHEKIKRSDTDLKKEEAAQENPNEMALGGEDAKLKIRKPDPTPDCEWWDAPLLRDRVQGKDWVLDPGKITIYVEHPVATKMKEKEVKEMAMFLTVKERKKLRRLRRQQKTKEMQDKIKMGLIPPPPPKVKMSNLMRVLGDAQVANPSAIESKVKDGILQRKEGHEQRNMARKLDPAERKKKKENKWSKDDNPTIHVQVYRIKDLSSKKNQFKIEANAQQFHMTGTMIHGQEKGVGNLVVVEGIVKSAKRFRKLMLNRMKWNENAVESDDDSDDDGVGKVDDDCVLIWEGETAARAFENWKTVTVKSDHEARETLKERGGEQYWDIFNQWRDPNLDVGL